MNKLKIILINLVLFVVLWHVADFYASLKCWQTCWIYKISENIFFTYIKQYKIIHNYSIVYNEEEAVKEILYKNKDTCINLFRPVENVNASKSILIFGCSFAYGAGLGMSETFSYNLGKELPYYRINNRAKSSWTTSHMLYQLENDDFSDIPILKYVIYVFITEHIARTFWAGHVNAYTPYYNYNNLVLDKYSLKYGYFPMSLFFRNKIESFIYKNLENKNKSVIISKKILEKSKFESELKFGPDTKFIILRYDRGEEEPYNWMFEELKEEGFIVVSLKDLSGTNYSTPKYQISETDAHPNALAWSEITPLFVKYLQDRGYFKD